MDNDMQFAIEHTAGLEHKMKLTVSATEIRSQIDERLRQTAKKVSLKGFRPGRAPIREVKRRFGAEISDEIVRTTMVDSFFKVVQEESLKPAGIPEFKRISETIDEDFVFEATFESLPDVQIGDLSSIKVTKVMAEVADTDLAVEINQLRKSRQHFHEANDRAAEAGDKVHIAWMADSESSDDQGATTEQDEKTSSVILDTEAVSAEIIEQLKGVRVGDVVTLKLSSSQQPDNTEESKKTLKCTIQQIEAPHLPELNEKFFKSIGVEGDEESFRQHIRTSMTNRFEEMQQKQAKTQVFQALTDMHQSLALPKVLITEEIKRMQAQPEHAPSNQLPGKQSDDNLRQKAEEIIRLQLVLQQLVKEYELKAGDDEIKAKIEQMASMYPEPHLFVKWYYEDKNRVSSVQNQILEELLIERVLIVADVSEKLMSYPEAVKEASKQPDLAE